MRDATPKTRRSPLLLTVLAVCFGATLWVSAECLLTYEDLEEEYVRCEAALQEPPMTKLREQRRRAAVAPNQVPAQVVRDAADLESMLASVRAADSPDALTRLATDAADVRARIAALRKLAAPSTPSARATFVRLSRDQTQPDRVRAEAARCLAGTGPGALGELSEIVESWSPATVRRGAVLGLGDLGTPEGVALLLELADRGPVELREAALRALASSGRPGTIAALSEASRDVRCLADTRVAACRALAATRDPAAAPALRELAAAAATAHRVRAAAVEGIGTMGDAGGRKAVAAASRDRSPEVEQVALTARTRLAHVR